jgi:endoglucanase
MDLSIWFTLASLSLSLDSCQPVLPTPGTTIGPSTIASSPPIAISATAPPKLDDLLQQSWAAYRQRFIQGDGRVIDREADDRSISEGQAYAMLRAVMIGDRDTFDRTLQWAENNLQRQTDGKRSDNLWAWKWGRSAQGEWRTIDGTFASDGDVDAITALILAARRWNHTPYLDLARTKLADLWKLATIARADGKTRYLLPGPASVFQQQTIVQLNPSYFAPYAFRLFAQVDPSHDWLSLVDSSYEVLQQAAKLSRVGLPNDWVLVDVTTGEVKPLPTPNPGSSDYSFDAYRVWWRVALDASWFQEARAKQFLQSSLRHPQQLWRSHQKIPARINLAGKPTVTYEATSQYAMLYPALQLVDPETASQMKQQKLLPPYRNGFWDNDSAYYTQNLVWLGLAPPTEVAALLRP